MTVAAAMVTAMAEVMGAVGMVAVATAAVPEAVAVAAVAREAAAVLAKAVAVEVHQQWHVQFRVVLCECMRCVARVAFAWRAFDAI